MHGADLPVGYARQVDSVNSIGIPKTASYPYFIKISTVGPFGNWAGILIDSITGLSWVGVSTNGSYPVWSAQNNMTGMVAYYTNSTVPNGWLKANGAAVSRVTYAELFSKINTMYGAGDGSTTFNLPDLRGQFPRGLDDGRGVDPGRGIGSTQGDAIRNIIANIDSGLGEQNTINATGAFAIGTGYDTGTSGDFHANQRSLNFDASRVVPTANENRPTNVALLACIKY